MNFAHFLGFLLKTGVANIILENKFDIEFVYLFKTYKFEPNMVTLRHITPLIRKLTFWGDVAPLRRDTTAI